MSKQFNIKEIVPNISFTIKHNDICLPSIRNILDPKYGITIDFDVYLESYGCNLQRDYCWNNFQKEQFIYSIFKEISIPTLSIIDYSPTLYEKHSIFKVIDGKQRLSTLLQFCQDVFKINNNGYEWYFNELPDNLKFRLLSYNFHSQMAYSYAYEPSLLISDDDLVAWYNSVNFAGTPQDKDYMKMLQHNKIKHNADKI